jgi:hypothetical protein
MPEDTAEGVKDRLAKRFEGSGDDAGQPSDDSLDETSDDATPQSDTGAVDGEGRRAGKSASSKKAKNVKKEWNALSFYLRDDLKEELGRTYKRLDWQLEKERELSIKKIRHYYPLVVALGLDQLDEMDAEAVAARLEDLDG